ncbi:zinc finger BED domain-containing protein 1-like [Rhizophagus clarus]|uniref:Zinc finger BED domain-containing protein 1-like n=1 Tax=Rhizophagus clarus TaxID=94130 RepID=A0A8H3LSV3_9GLOM|nr:zinc finger BED domain-containing protein 1-like [Rhizophagus clarus]
MASLKKKFTPRPDKNETVKTYLMLVYGESYEENDDDEITDDDIPSAGTQRIEDTNKVEDLSPVNTSDLLEKWSTNNERDRVHQLVKNLYNELKTNFHILDDNEDRNSMENDDGGLFSDLEDIRIKDDPLMWWSNHKDSFPTLVQLAKKYLSIPSTLMLSE